MYKINSRWNKFVNGIIQGSGWILIAVLTVLILMFTQLDTWHPEEGSLTSIIDSYNEYGVIHRITVSVKGEADLVDTGEVDDDGKPIKGQVTILKYYTLQVQKLESEIQKLKAELNALPESELDVREAKKRTIADKERRWERALLDLQIIESGALKGLDILTSYSSTTKYNWYGEYHTSKIIYLVTTDIYAWILVVIIGATGIIIKTQGAKSGKHSGLKLIWKTTSRHWLLAEKISPHSKDAEIICERLNAEELYKIRDKRLSYVALKYSDVFTEDGKFKDKINFVTPQIFEYKTLKGVIKYRVDKYQSKLLKKQKAVVEKLKTYYPVEVHVHNLLETKQIYSERFDLGISIEKHERKRKITNIITSMSTMIPMFASVAFFVYSKNTTNLLIGVLGTIMNAGSLLINMFGMYSFIIDKYQDSLVKKSDILLQIGNELGLTGEIENSWNDILEKEAKKEIESKKKRAE